MPRQKVTDAASAHVPLQWMRPISCRTVGFFLIHSSGSRKITGFSFHFPFSLVHVSTPQEIWLKAFKDLIRDSGRDKGAPAERVTATLCCTLACFAAALRLSDQPHLHSVGFESTCGKFYTAKCEHLTLHWSGSKVICIQYHTDI